MNPHSIHSISVVSLFKSIWLHRQLIQQMAWREVVGRYKGSVMGLLWSLINPILMLVVYTFVFSVVFKVKWGLGDEESKTSFALLLFAGIIVHGLFAEVLNRSPSVILSNVNYVKKVVFPLEVLPIIILIASLFHSIISLSVLIISCLVINGHIPWTIVFAPVVLLPLTILVLGLSWIISSLGVYLRDVQQTIGIITTVMLFMAPVFFPMSAMPSQYHPYIYANPLTFIIEQLRAVLIFGRFPDLSGLAIYMVLASSTAWLGYVWFQKTRKGFSDVL